MRWQIVVLLFSALASASQALHPDYLVWSAVTLQLMMHGAWLHALLLHM
jgi:hypothetical protein